jgi:hypothetical protein
MEIHNCDSTTIEDDLQEHDILIFSSSKSGCSHAVVSIR